MENRDSSARAKTLEQVRKSQQEYMVQRGEQPLSFRKESLTYNHLLKLIHPDFRRLCELIEESTGGTFVWREPIRIVKS